LQKIAYMRGPNEKVTAEKNQEGVQGASHMVICGWTFPERSSGAKV
jgi:hypothetical protein